MTKYKSIFISDLHLGSKASQPEPILQLLRENEFSSIFLVGDIIDGWRLRQKWYMPSEHIAFLRYIFKLSTQTNTSILYITGNHDEFLRDADIDYFGNIMVADEALLPRQNMVILHGDQFDGIMNNCKWLMPIGDALYTLLVAINYHMNTVRNWFGLPYWSLSKYLKSKSKQAMSFISNYEKEAADYAKQNKFAKIMCGHIHAPANKTINGVEYWNIGDMCETLTCILETEEGELYHVQYRNGLWQRTDFGTT